MSKAPISGFDLLGIDLEPQSIEHSTKWYPIAAAAIGGIAGAVLWRSHPILGHLGGWALGRNIYGLATKERTLPQVGRTLGSHAVATAASLSLPAYPVLGYIAGAVASDLLLNSDEGLKVTWRPRQVERSDEPPTTALVVAR